MADDGTEGAVDFPENPEDLKGVYDLSMLVYLEMYHVMVNLKARYSEMSRKHPYTSISTVLVAINPYQLLPIYGEEVIDDFFQKQQEFRHVKGKPHPFGVAARAFMRMVQRGIAQSTIVCGESGAGKSETAKLMMRYLAMTSSSEDSFGGSVIAQQIQAASPILEAFGNAKTVWNNNSSRFGKFTKLLYERQSNKQAFILGSYLETYLLEKSRVVFQSKNERNYHVFYFVQQGMSEERRAELGLKDLMDFNYTNQGKCTVVPGISDNARFLELQNSLKIMRVTSEDQDDLWTMVAGILHLGNITYKKDDQGYGKIDDKCKVHVDLCAKFWGITTKALTKRLETKSMKVMKKSIEKQINEQDSVANRNAIAKSIFENSFLWVCSRINAELFNNDDVDDQLNMVYIGVLDVFGFENFKVNSLEQFCINFTNEKLQSFFNDNIIKSEQEEYIAESVFWTPIEVPDNSDLINLIENKDNGMYRTLDDQCRNAKPDTEAFYQEMMKNWRKNVKMKAAKAPRKKKGKKQKKYFGFWLSHYAEDVKYNLENFIVKNMDAIHSDTNKMFKTSKSPLVKLVGGKKWVKGSKKFSSVTSVFHKGITNLMKNLKSTEPYFVRCVNPNRVKSPMEWDGAHVEKQLRCGGIVEALRVLKLGYPTRVPYDTLYDRFHAAIENPLIRNLDPAGFAEAILMAWDVTKKDYELGLTKIFFKPAKAAILDEIMEKAGQPLTPEQNEKITNWVVGKRHKQFFGTLRVLTRLAFFVKHRQARTNWNTWGRTASFVGLTVMHHVRVARARVQLRKQNEASRIIQNFYVACRSTIDTKARLKRVKSSVALVWETYRRYEMKQDFYKWLTQRVEETRAERRRLEEEERKRKEELERQLREQKAAEEERLRKEKELADKLKSEEQKRQDELKRKQREEAERLERERIEAERIAEEKRLEQKKRDEEEKAKALKESAAQLERGEGVVEQEEAAYEAAQHAQHDKEMQEHVDKAYRNRKAKKKKTAQAKEDKLQREEAQHEKESQEHYNRMFPERMADKDDMQASDDDYSESDEQTDGMDDTKDVRRLLGTGQLFLKYTGKKRRRPQDRFVKVSFDGDNPKNISWGSGSRYISFNDIIVIAWGHYTQVFQDRKTSLDENLCFSVVGKEQVLDLSASDRGVVETWVKGLRQLKGMDAEQSDALAEKMMKEGTMPGAKTSNRSKRRKSKSSKGAHKKRTKSLMLLQQDLFVMTCTTVFRNLEEEGIYNVKQEVRDKFNAKELYERALHDDIPWRQWAHWIRDKVIEHLDSIGALKEPKQPQYGSDPDPNDNGGEKECLIS